MNRSKLKSRYTKWLSCAKFLDFKKQKNICKNLKEKDKKELLFQNYFKLGDGKKTILEYNQAFFDVQRFSS